MSNPVLPGWPDPAALPFPMFGASPFSAASGSAAGSAPGLAAGVDLMKSFWGKLPGGSAMPGFLVPTVDLEELDKRISDLRAAESWLEVNMNMLRATIQGLEVQRHTIAAIQSLSAMADASIPRSSGSPPAAASAAAPGGGLPAGWPMSQATAAPAAPSAATGSPPAPPATPPAIPSPSPGASQAADESASPSASDAAVPTDAAPDAAPAPSAEGSMMAGLAANNWLGFMQEQFARVAQAALASGDGSGSRPSPQPAPTAAAPRKRAAASAAAKKSIAGRKRTSAR